MLGLAVVLTGVVAYGLCSMPTSVVRAQQSAGKIARFPSADGVELRGTFFAGDKQSATVLLLHDLEEDSHGKTWRSLANALHRKGHAVLLFDFRGHGDSTEVDAAEFWSSRYPSNRYLVRGFPQGEISHKNFDSRYYPVLANDITAAKAYLDRRNDDGQCNSSNLVVIGAGAGATLGGLWMNAEWRRHELRPASFPRQAPQLEASPQGKNILCAMWLSIDAKLGSRNVNLPALLDLPGRHGEVPMVLMHGENDELGEKQATACAKRLNLNKKLRYTAAVEVPRAGKLTGAALLDDRLQTQKAILEYIDSVLEDRGNEWIEQDFEDRVFVWRLDAGPLQPANRLGERTPLYFAYERLLPPR
jgi:alpha-beta hydrolase superfamily lysophospholipase